MIPVLGVAALLGACGAEERPAPPPEEPVTLEQSSGSSVEPAPSAEPTPSSDPHIDPPQTYLVPYGEADP